MAVRTGRNTFLSIVTGRKTLPLRGESVREKNQSMEERKAGRSKNFTKQMVVNMEGNIYLPIVTKVNTFPLRWESVWEETKAWKKEGRAE